MTSAPAARPGAFLAIWHDVGEDVRSEYLRWHSFEHLPERLGLPGFLRAQRLEKEDGPGQDFCCVVEVSGMADFSSAAYLARLDAPTPWTRKLMPHYGRVVRALCRTVVDEGKGLAPVFCTLRARAEGEGLATDLPLRLAEIGQRTGATTGVTRLLAGVADPALGRRDTEERRLRGGDRSEEVDLVVVVGAVDADALRAARRQLGAALSGSVAILDVTDYKHSFAASAP